MRRQSLRTTCAAMLLTVAMLLASGTAVSPSLASAAKSADLVKAPLWPQDGDVYTNLWVGPIQTDLTEAGDNDRSHQWEVSFRDDSGTWRLVKTIWGNDEVYDINVPSVGPGRYAVRLDPLWLGDAYTIENEFTVVDDPTVRVTAMDGGQPFPYGRVRVEAFLNYPPNPPAGDVVHWTVHRRGQACGDTDQPACDPVAAGTLTPEGGMDWLDLPIPALSGGTYEVTLYRAAAPNADRSTDWFVVDPAPEATDLGLAPRTFYPLITDGYRDRVTLSWRQSLTTATAVEVLRDGATIRLDQLGTLPAGGHTWTWNGRSDTGERAAPGTYEMRVYVTDKASNTGFASTTVTLASGIVTHRRSLERRATNTTARTKTGTCGFRAADRELKLSCTGKGYARATYEYRIPRNAFDVRAGVGGQQHCCSPGQVRIVGKRISPTRYRTTVKVTGRRSYTIAWADLRYKYKVRR